MANDGEGNNSLEVEKTELVWPGKRKEVERVNLPFQTIETINLPRGYRQEEIFGTGILDGWKNRLIWGDNLLIMGSLLKEFAGKINLIYIDPPFATGDNFSFEVRIGDQEITKEPSALEVKAYRDTWGKGMQSYLQMMYDRLVLMKELLTDNGSIYVHLDWHVGHYVKAILDEVFGKENFRNEIIWKKLSTPKAQTIGFGNVHDSIYFYSRSSGLNFTQIKQEHREEYLEAMYRYVDLETDRRYRLHDFTQKGQGEPKKFGDKVLKPPQGKHWIWSQENIDEGMKKGLIVFSKTGTPQVKRYLDEVGGHVLDDLWIDVKPIGSVAEERLDYDTQKPKALLERIITASSNEGDLVADFFCGSGTTGVMAEKLNRRWLMSDLGRFAIHTTRKRLLDIKAKPFVVQNLGRYERHRWVTKNGTYRDYLNFILELYRAEPASGYNHLHGKKVNAFIQVGAVDAPVTLSDIQNALKECVDNNIHELHVLGWEWEMGLHDLVKDEAEKRGVKLVTLQIPREVMELSIKDKDIKNEIQFFELAYLDADVTVDGKKAVVELKDFMIPNPDLLPDEVKSKVKDWSDFIDYWAVDWMFNQHKEQTEEDDTFHNMDQEYRTRKNPKLVLSMGYEYEKSGKYNILVKVIDIFGNDTTKLVEIKI